MHIVIYLVTLGAIASLSSAANLTVASSIDDYISVNKRKLQRDILDSENKIACVESRGADSIAMMKNQQQELLREVKHHEEKLNLMESLSVIHRHCVQSYKGLLISQTIAESRTRACIKTAETQISTLTAGAKTNLASAKTAADVDLPKALTACNTTHHLNQTAYEDCVVNRIQYDSNRVDLNLRAVDKSLDASLCTNTDTSKETIKCYFTHEKTVLTTIGKVDVLIDKCVSDTGATCPCAKDLMIEKDTARVSVRKMLMGS